MIRARSFSDEDITYLRNLFEETISTAHNIYGDLLARPWDAQRQEWLRAQVAFADAVFVAISRNTENAESLVAKREAIVVSTQELFAAHPPGTFTGRGNTKRDVQDRIDLFERMLASHLG
jgi:hypothetical protein